MKPFFIISLALLATSSWVYAIDYPCTLDPPVNPPTGSYTSTCNQLDYQESTNTWGQSICVLSAYCQDDKKKDKFTRLSGLVGQFPEECRDIKNQNGHLKCVR